RQFLDHCEHGTNHVTGGIGSPLDFISFHAKGAPEFTNGHVRMGMANQFKNMDDAFAVIASFPQYKNLPIVIGESDPEGCAACREPRDAYRNGTMYSSYTAASFSREYELAARHGVNLEGALTWAFEFENQPPFAGFRQVASDGIDLPVLNVFRMFGKMSGDRVAVESSAGLDVRTILKSGVRDAPDVSALASLDKNRLAVLVWQYHDDDVPGPDANIDLSLNNLPFATGAAKVTQYRIDADHSNSYAAWLRMGSPHPLSDGQYSELEKAGQLAMLGAPETLQIESGKASVKLRLPRQGVALLLIEPQ
ncbi:MAG TPA: beta-xylosidase, partial [Verrucomicrobiae bacterium]